MTLTYNTYKNTNVPGQKSDHIFLVVVYRTSRSFYVALYSSREPYWMDAIFDELQKNNVNIHNEKCRTTKCVSKCINSEGAKIFMIHI